MVESCVVVGCTSRCADSSLSFHRIPKEEKRIQLWLNTIKSEHWTPRNNDTSSNVIMEDQDSLVVKWHELFKEATDFDTWGQPLEAAEHYKKLSKQLHQHASVDHPLFTDEQKKLLDKITVCLDARCKSLQHRASIEGVSLDDLRCLESTLKNLAIMTGGDFPVDVTVAQIQTHKYPKIGLLKNGNSDEDKSLQKAHGNILPKPLQIRGKTLLTIRVEKIAVKDTSQFIDPFITVSVKDPTGQDMTSRQDTPTATEKRDSCIFFNVDVYIQKTVESLPPGFAVFFEMKHYKPKKKMTSTKCWTFLERDEIKDGPVFLELYKKPTDCQRKKVSLLTVKPLYLYLKLSLVS